MQVSYDAPNVVYTQSCMEEIQGNADIIKILILLTC